MKSFKSKFEFVHLFNLLVLFFKSIVKRSRSLHTFTSSSTDGTTPALYLDTLSLIIIPSPITSSPPEAPFWWVFQEYLPLPTWRECSEAVWVVFTPRHVVIPFSYSGRCFEELPRLLSAPWIHFFCLFQLMSPGPPNVSLPKQHKMPGLLLMVQDAEFLMLSRFPLCRGKTMHSYLFYFCSF